MSCSGLRTAFRRSGRVVIVDVDERSLARFGRWPWPRGQLARLLEKIEALGAASVGIDMIFAEPDETLRSPAQQPSSTLDYKPRAGLSALTPNDAALAAVLSRGTFILGYNLRFGVKREDGSGCVLHPIPVVTLQKPGGKAEVAALFQASAVLCSLPGLADAAAGSGFLNAAPDADGILRRMPLMIAHDGLVYPSLGLATLVPVLGIRQFVLRTTGGRMESLALEDIVVPLDPRGGLLLHFRGGKQTFPHISAADVLGDQLPEGCAPRPHRVSRHLCPRARRQRCNAVGHDISGRGGPRYRGRQRFCAVTSSGDLPRRLPSSLRL